MGFANYVNQDMGFDSGTEEWRSLWVLFLQGSCAFGSGMTKKKGSGGSISLCCTAMLSTTVPVTDPSA